MLALELARYSGLFPAPAQLDLISRAGLLLIALALLLSTQRRTDRFAVIATRVLGVVVMLAAFAAQSPTVLQVRISLLLAGMAILCLTARKRSASRLAQLAGLAIWISAILSIAACAYGLTVFFKFGYFSEIPLYSAIALLCAAISIFFAQPQTGPASIFASHTAGGRVARRLLLPICLICPFAGFLTGIGQHFEADLCITLLVLNIAVPIGIWLLSNSLSRHETDKVTIINSLNSALVVVDRHGQFTLFNELAKRIIGVGASEAAPALWPEVYGLYLPDKSTPYPAGKTPLYRALRGETTSGVEMFVRNPSRPQGVWIRANSFPLRDTVGELQGAVAVFEDITAAKEAEIRRSMQHAVASILAESPTLREASPKIIQVLCEGMGWDCGTIWSKQQSSATLTCEDFWHFPDVDVSDFEEATRQFKCVPGQALLGRVWTTEQPAWSQDVAQEPHFVRGAAAQRSRLQAAFLFPLLLHHKVTGIIELFKQGVKEAPHPQQGDYEMITTLGNQIGQFIERKHAEENVRQLNLELQTKVGELAVAHDRAQEALKLKAAFIANMSHELRTPLSGVLGMNELLMASELNPEQIEYAQAIHTSAQALLGLVNDILDISRIEADKMIIERKPFNLLDTIANVQKMAEPAARLKNLKLDTQIDSGVPGQVSGDALRCQQVLLNLLSNAVKFTDSGEVKLTICVHSRTGSQIYLKFSVSDTGIGIGEEDRRFLFVPFSQVDSSSTRRHGGAGLGLTISKRIVELMGGEIGYQSENEGGSTFWFTIPFQPVEEDRDVRLPEESPNSSLLNGRILVIEDNELLQHLTKKQLERLGLCCDVFGSAEEGLEQLKGGSYSLVLMDCYLPHMDGFTATRMIRKDEAKNGHRIPVIAVTAGAMRADLDKCFASGMDDCLTKPYTFEELQDKLSAWLSKKNPGADPGGKQHLEKLDEAGRSA